MFVLIFTSLITIPRISSMLEQIEESQELPELEHIDNFLASLQNQIGDGRLIFNKVSGFEQMPGFEQVPGSYQVPGSEHVPGSDHLSGSNQVLGSDNKATPVHQELTTPSPYNSGLPLQPHEFDYPGDIHTSTHDHTEAQATEHSASSHGKPPEAHKPLLYLNDTDNFLESKGYFSTGLEFFLKLIITKNPEDIIAVVSHSKSLFERMSTWSSFDWLDEPLIKVVRNIVTALSDLDYDYYKGAIEEFYKQMVMRRTLYRPAVNDIFDAADKLVEKEDGKVLFSVLNEFQDYPAGNVDGETLCENIIRAFNVPFMKLKGLYKLVDVTNAANEALINRFPLIERMARRLGNVTELLNERAHKRVTLLTHVDLFLGGLQDQLLQSADIVRDINNKILHNNTVLSDDTFVDNMNNTELISQEHTNNECSACYKKIQDHGYLSYAWQKLWVQIILKKPEEVENVLVYSKRIIENKNATGKLDWMGTSLKKFIFGIASAFSDLPINLVIHSAAGVYNDMKYRHKVFSPEVNNILDFANNLIQKEDGDHLIQVIRVFENFPDDTASKTNKQMCEDIIEAFERPFLKNPEGSATLQKMIDTIKYDIDGFVLRTLITQLQQGAFNNKTRKFDKTILPKRLTSAKIQQFLVTVRPKSTRRILIPEHSRSSTKIYNQPIRHIRPNPAPTQYIIANHLKSHRRRML